MSEPALPLQQRFRLSRFFRGEAPQPGPITLNQRRIFILPTLSGLVFVLLIALLLLIAFVYNNNLAYLLGFLLASVFFVTILHSYRALAGLIVQAGQNAPVFAGDNAGFTFHLHNPTPHNRLALNIGLNKHAGQDFHLPARQSQLLTVYTPASQRGWLNCDTLTLSSQYPLGLFRAWSPLRFDCRLLVYPKPSPHALPFPDSDGKNSEQGQQRKSGDEFYGVRDYQPGDPLRQIHWRALAKGQGLHSRQYGGESSRELWLDYAATPGQSTEERLSQLCRWLIDAEQMGLGYGLNLPTLRLDSNRGEGHYQQCLQALALF